MSKPSGKPRSHKGSNRGRPPKNREYLRKLEQDNARLRLLNAHRVNNTALWKAVSEVFGVASMLEAQATSLSSKPWDSSGHGAETPLFSGTRMAPADDEDAFDELRHAGSREIMHNGKHAAWLLNQLTRNVEWAASKAREELVKRPAPMKPRAPSLADPADCAACQ